MKQDMQDSLEEFIRKNKEEFDDLSPKKSTWKNVHRAIESKPNYFNRMLMWKVAAIALFLFSLGLTLFVNRDYLLPSTEAIIVYDDEFIETEAYYTSVINQRQEAIKSVAYKLPDVERDFELEWTLLDKSYKEIKQEYGKNNSEEIRNALLQNLRARVSLLNRQMEVLEQIKKQDAETIKI